MRSSDDVKRKKCVVILTEFIKSFTDIKRILGEVYTHSHNYTVLAVIVEPKPPNFSSSSLMVHCNARRAFIWERKLSEKEREREKLSVRVSETEEKKKS